MGIFIQGIFFTFFTGLILGIILSRKLSGSLQWKSIVFIILGWILASIISNFYSLFPEFSFFRFVLLHALGNTVAVGITFWQAAVLSKAGKEAGIAGSQSTV